MSVRVKQCKKCKQWKKTTEFPQCKECKLGVRTDCKECVSKYHRNWREKNKHRLMKPSVLLKAKYAQYKSRCGRLQRCFELDFPIFATLCSSPCVYCGSVSEWNGVDRIDNAQGYTVQNSAPCCEWCNRMKWKFSKEDFINKVTEISRWIHDN